MSYQDMIDAQRHADYEWDDALQAGRGKRDVFRAEDSHTTVTVILRNALTYDLLPVRLPAKLGRRMNALAERIVIFYRYAPGQCWSRDGSVKEGTQHNYVLAARLPDGRTRSVRYPPNSGQYALDRVAELIEWAEREIWGTA